MDSQLSLLLLNKLNTSYGYDGTRCHYLHGKPGHDARAYRKYLERISKLQDNGPNVRSHRRMELMDSALAGGFTNPAAHDLLQQAAYLEIPEPDPRS
jgi:hypothetical protein